VGTYIVSPSLDSGCPAFTTNTIVITHNPGSVVLANNEVNFKGTLKNNMVNLNWSVSRNQDIYFLPLKEVPMAHILHL
jgi:hypothetical protein